MTGHVMIWLGAYVDGELRGRRLRQVEAHLEDCAACRAELESLRALSALLGESPSPATLTPPERFVVQVGLRLPRRPERSSWQKTLEIGWQLAPLGLFGAWAFLQAVLAVAGVVLLLQSFGLGGEVLAGLPMAAPAGPSLAEIFTLSAPGLDGVGRITLYLLKDGGPLGWGITLYLVSLAVIGLLCWSWLASWWVRLD